jgi:hypothetical protein
MEDKKQCKIFGETQNTQSLKMRFKRKKNSKEQEKKINASKT